MDFELSENVFSNELSEQHSSCSSGYRLLKIFSYKKSHHVVPYQHAVIVSCATRTFKFIEIEYTDTAI